MKTKLHLWAIAGMALLASCKDNSADADETVDSTTVTTQSTDNAMVVEAPENVRTAFETKYPQATNVRWQYHRPDVVDIDWEWSGWTGLDDRDYLVTYNWDGSEYWAWYDQDGNWIGTVNRAESGSLPSQL